MAGLFPVADADHRAGRTYFSGDAIGRRVPEWDLSRCMMQQCRIARYGAEPESRVGKSPPMIL
jgi:hypothetical protein